MIRKKILDRFIPGVHRCIKRTSDTANPTKAFRDYLGIGGFTFLDGIVSYDKKGIRYEDWNEGIIIDLTHKEVVEHAISGAYQEQTTMIREVTS